MSSLFLFPITARVRLVAMGGSQIGNKAHTLMNVVLGVPYRLIPIVPLFYPLLLDTYLLFPS